MKTETQKALEIKRQELKDIKDAGKRAQSQLKKDVASIRNVMKTLRENVKTDKSDDRFYRKQVIADRKMERAAAKATRIAAMEEKLEALKNPVGIKAKKAAKKPSKVTIINPMAALEAAMSKKAA